MSLAAFCPSLVLTMALWRLMTPTLGEFSAGAGRASASPTTGKTKAALFTTNSLRESILCRAARPDYFGGAAGFAAGTAGLGAGGRAAAGAGAAEVAAGAFLS